MSVWKSKKSRGLRKYVSGICFFIACIFLLIIPAQKSYGSHSMGADLTYRYLGGNSYEITLSFYRDCAGIDADDSAYVNFTSSCYGSDSIYLQRIPGTGQEISPICPSDTTTCNGGRFTGIQEYVYRGVITLQGPCADWTFSYNLCCRNWAITNIDQPGNTFMYIYATLDNTVVAGNNSPTFSNKPVPFACLGQQFCFNHGAYDVDGDSLVYSLITPYDSPGLPITYMPAFSATSPLSSTPPVSFNTMTGDICMTPTALEVTVMAVLVQEYRNGVLIGSVERDIQVTVLNCNNQLPTLTGIDGTGNFSETICAGSQSCFTIYSADPDVPQSTFVNWDNSIPAGSFTVLPGARQSATFCWTPTVADISHIPYCFTVTVNDNNCPYIGSQVYSYCIKVTGISVDAGPDQSVGCNSFTTLSASASGGNGIYTYRWDNGATTSSITAGSGTYVVTASDGACTNRDTVNVLASNAVPTANFSPFNSCSGTSVQFTDLSTITGDVITSWNWSFGDGNTSALQNPLHNYSTTGSYPVLLIIHSGGGCIDTLARTLIVSYDQPTALFSSNNVCLGSPVNFTDQSSSPVAVTSWSWNFGDAVTSTVENPAHTYLAPGSYPVSFILTNISGCTDSVTRTVIVHPMPVAYAGSDSGLCEGSSITLTATGGVSYSWAPGGLTSASITVTPPATQTYTVTVTDANDCSAIDAVVITVNPNPVADAGIDQTICAGSSATLSGSGGGNYLWNPGGSTTQLVVVSPVSSTNYLLTVTNASGCVATDQVFVTVNAAPVANAGPDQSVCSGSQVTLLANGGGTYQWLPGGSADTTFTITPVSSITYLLTVTNAAGCQDTDHVSVTVNPFPVATFSSPPIVCEGTVVHFSDMSSISSGAILSWNWNLGNSTFSSLQSPSILYADTGEYHVSVIVTSDAGCRDTGTATVVVASVPVASFTAPDACLHDTVSFLNNSTISSGEYLNYNWDFGDTTFSLLTNPVHTYSAYGHYSSTLIVISSRGCRDTVSQAITVHPLPSVAFSNYPVCQSSPVQFTDLSSIVFGGLSSWNWNFGDGFLTSIRNPLHTYSAGGLYTVQLEVVSNFGCRDSVVHQQRIFPDPVPDFTGGDKCLGDTIRFTNLSHIAGGSITMYQWNLGDNTLDYSFSPVHLYRRPGNYAVKLSVVSDSGCTASVTIPSSAIVYPLPQASFVPNTTEVEEIFPYVVFDNQSTSVPFNSWSFGDGTFSSDVSPNHLYQHTGIFEVQLVVIDQNGCKDSSYSKVEVKPVTSIFIPNAFTPNGDGVNDTFHPFFVNRVSVAMQIFDRWGKKIVEWDDLNGSWDGMYDGRQAPADVYVYHLESVDIFGKKDVRIGHVVLIR